jgi:cyclic pyranopterin phosphate synthase
MLTDAHGRTIRYLRLSVTPECNLRCAYCRPLSEEPDSGPALSDEPIVRLCSLLAREGVERIRITGGEPLLRPGLTDLIRSLTAIPGIRQVSLTTNGVLLAEQARDLAASGLRRVNVSIDSLRDERFAEITGGGSLNDVFKGIVEAESAGIHPIKINCVVMRGVNDDEVGDFARLTVENPWHVRFIELMPIGPVARDWNDLYVSNSEVRERLSKEVALVPMDGSPRYPEYHLPASCGGVIAFISPVSEPFCAACDRLRLLSDGTLRPCLCSDDCVNLGRFMNLGAGDEEILRAVRDALAAKPACGVARLQQDGSKLMASIGG